MEEKNSWSKKSREKFIIIIGLKMIPHLSFDKYEPKKIEPSSSINPENNDKRSKWNTVGTWYFM